MTEAVLTRERTPESAQKELTNGKLDLAHIRPDISHILTKELVVYELHVGQYLPRPDYRLPRIKLGLTIWAGVFEDKFDRWLRWCDAEGNLLHTSAELAKQERQRAEQEQQRAEQERQRAEQAQARADRYAANYAPLALIPINHSIKMNKHEDRQ